jgi:predicted secreted hydrolase
VLIAVAMLGAGLGLVIALGSGRSAPPTLRATLSIAEALGGGPADGFARALVPRALAFPADHGPHPAFRTEWWYWTGNLRAPAGDGGVRRFGFQLTFFRTALAPSVAPRRSAWGARDVYTAHLALTDVAAGRFHARDRWARAALDLAGATGDPVRVWLGDWTAEGVPPDGLPLRLRAGDDDVRIALALATAKPPVLHGERGLSRKSAEPGNASYYYSLTRMPAVGEVRVGGRAFPVEGLAWMDREWSTSALGPDLVGWDWFALQLDDGRELMLYRLRRRDGGIDPASQGTLVAADGAARSLDRDAVEVVALDHWTSPRGGTRYPARWRLRIAALALELTVTPLLADQELDLALRYWEGAVRVEGTADGRPLGGAGYVELVGYATRAEGVGEAMRQ